MMSLTDSLVCVTTLGSVQPGILKGNDTRHTTAPPKGMPGYGR